MFRNNPFMTSTRRRAGLPSNLPAAMVKLWTTKWFFLGFSSGRDPARDETSGQHLNAQNNVEAVHEWLAGIYDGRWRTLVPGRIVEVDGHGRKTVTERWDGGLFVITFAELEKIMDALRSDATQADVDFALLHIKPLIDSIEQESHDYEVPF